MKYLNAILLVIAVGTTVGLFYLLAAEPDTPLFFFNLGFACFLEILFFGGIFTVSKKHLFNIPNVAVSYQIGYYVAFSALLMLAYNLFLTDKFEPKWYFAALILLTVVYAIVIIFVIKGAVYQHKAAEKGTVLMEQRTDAKLNGNNLIFTYNDAVAMKKLDYRTMEKSKKAIDLLVEKSTMIPLGKLERNRGFADNVNNKINQLSDYIQLLGSEEDTETILNNIASKATEISRYIDQTKSTLV